jgi:hypothetical protein
VKVEPPSAVAVSVVSVPTGHVAVQVAPHEIPAGALVTVPAPVPLLVTLTVAGVPAVAAPLSPRDTVSPLTVTLTLPAKVPVAVGANRTVTTWLAPGASDSVPPATTLNGAPALAVPEILAVLVF